MSSVTRTYFTLSVFDMARAVAFYRGVLGPVVRVESPTWSELKLGDATVALHTTPVPSPRYTGLGVEVVDLHAAYHAVTALGGKVLSGPSPDPTGNVSYEVADTEGNTFTIAGATPGSEPAAPPPRGAVGGEP
jgi:predicted enzyme related to lactoylglutathione lyase